MGYVTNLQSAGILTQRVVPLLTAAGQRRIHTGLSPLRLMAAPHQNRLVPYNNTVAVKLFKISYSLEISEVVIIKSYATTLRVDKDSASLFHP